jgi:hypothetical protein
MAQRDDRSPEEIRRDIEQRRERLAATVNELSGRVRESVDWKIQFARHPYAGLGATAVAGFLVARLLFGRRGSRRRTVVVHQPAPEPGERPPPHAERGGLSRFARGLGGTARVAATSVAAKALADMATNRAWRRRSPAEREARPGRPAPRRGIAAEEPFDDPLAYPATGRAAERTDIDH